MGHPIANQIAYHIGHIPPRYWLSKTNGPLWSNTPRLRLIQIATLYIFLHVVGDVISQIMIVLLFSVHDMIIFS